MTLAQPTVRAYSKEPSIKPFRCPTCKTELGETNGTSLRIGYAAFPFVVTFSCLQCGSMVKWRPTNGNGYNNCNQEVL